MPQILRHLTYNILLVSDHRSYGFCPLARNLLTPQALFPIARQSLESRFDRTFLPFLFRRNLSLQIPLPRKNR
jgi:hypothetical protein